MESLSSLIPFLIIAFWIYTMIKRTRGTDAKGQQDQEPFAGPATREAADTQKPAPSGEGFFAGLARQYQEMQAAAQHEQRREATGDSPALTQDEFRFSGGAAQTIPPGGAKQIVTTPGGPVITSKPIEPKWWA